MSRCEKCNEWVLSLKYHRCSPQWEVWCEDSQEDREDAKIFHAVSAKSAVEKWAEYDDSAYAGYSIIRGVDAIVYVAKHGGNIIKKYIVSGKSVPEYSAKEIE
jgi:hypothetical protein